MEIGRKLCYFYWFSSLPALKTLIFGEHWRIVFPSINSSHFLYCRKCTFMTPAETLFKCSCLLESKMCLKIRIKRVAHNCHCKRSSFSNHLFYLVGMKSKHHTHQHLSLQSSSWSSCISCRLSLTWPCPSGGICVRSWCSRWWNRRVPSFFRTNRR